MRPSTAPTWTEAHAAFGRLEALAFDGTILVATCLGTRTALAFAAEVPNLRGVVLLGGPVLDLNHAEAATWTRPISSYARSTMKGSTFRRLLRSQSRRRLLKIARAKLRGR